MEVLCQKPESGATASSPRPRLPGQPGCHPTVKGGELEPRGRPRRGQGEERSAPPFPPTGLLSGLGARGHPVWRAAPRRDWTGQRPDGAEAGRHRGRSKPRSRSHVLPEPRGPGAQGAGEGGVDADSPRAGGKQGRPRPDHITTFSARTYIRAK